MPEQPGDIGMSASLNLSPRLKRGWMLEGAGAS
jgi:hypothetical protein